MLKAFSRRILLFLAILFGASFALVFLHALIEPTGFSRPIAAVGAGLAMLAMAVMWVALVKTDDYLTPRHCRFFMIGTASMTAIIGLGLLGYFYLGKKYPGSFLMFFGVAPAILALIFVFVAGIRMREAHALPVEYRPEGHGGFWGSVLPLLLALLAAGGAGTSLFRTIEEIRFISEFDSSAGVEAERTLRPEDNEIIERAAEALALGRELQENNQYRLAYDAFRKSALLGNLEARYELALIYSGDGFYRNLRRAVEELEGAAEEGHLESLYALGKAYRRGELGLEIDPEQAIVYFEQAAKRGHVQAQKQLANMYNRGEGTEANPEQAYHWFRRAAEQGDAVAQNDLGILLINGVGAPHDPEEGLYWLDLAADQGVTVAQYNLGQSYYEGQLVERDYGRAYHYFQQLAEKNIPHGLRMTGQQLLRGEGVERNETAAVAAFRKGAERGDPTSQYYLGYCYLNGVGVERDSSRALRLLESAAAARNAEAQLLMGRIYLDGAIVLRDPLQAAKWLTLASENGIEEAKELLDTLSPVLSDAEMSAVSAQVEALSDRQAIAR